MKRDYVIARLEAQGHRFEILVDPQLAFRLKSGEEVNIDDMLVGDIVYRDARKGLKASPESVEKVFGTTDIRRIAREIVKQGELQLTTEQRRAILEAKKKQVISFIARNAVDPKTGLPIPPTRIELAMEQARVGIDPYKDVESQALQIIRAISRVLPIKIARAVVTLRIPPAYAGRVYGQLSKLGEVKKTQWLGDGSLRAELEIPAGMQQEVIDKVNKLTRGEAEVQIRVVK
jgi:ribosome maturation protein SDO1